MEINKSSGLTGSASKKLSLIIRLCLVLFATVASVALAWTLVASHSGAHATTGINEYATQAEPWGIALDEARGHVWVAEPNCDSSPICTTTAQGAIGEYSLTNPGVGAQTFTPPATYNPIFAALDGSGNLWFTDPTHNAIGELVPASNSWKEYTAPTANAAPYDLLMDKNGNLWFTEINSNNIGFFNPSTQTFVETPTPTTSSHPYGITMDASGTIWFAENALAQLGKFTPTTTGTGITISEVSIGSGITPHLLTSDSKGNIWYSEAFAGQVGKYNPSLNTHKDYPVSNGLCATPTPGTPTGTPTTCPGTHISGIGVDSNGLVWFNDSLSARVGTLNPTTGQVSAIQFSYLGAHPHDGLVVQSNNNVWITELYGYRLGEVLASSSSTITPGPVSTSWYFAEGSVGGSFQEYLTLNNPSPTTTCAVDIKYLYTPSGGSPTSKTVTVSLAAPSRLSEDVNHDLGIAATQSNGAPVSIIATVNATLSPSCTGIVAERQMYFRFGGAQSGSDTLGATHSASKFYFADLAASSGYASFLSILNPPGNASATVKATYYANGQALKSQKTSVPGGTRGSINPTGQGLPQHVAAVVTSTVPIVVERPTYFGNVNGGSAGTVSGADTVIGAAALQSEWLFAQGYTASQSQEYLTIANLDPTNLAATVTIKLEYTAGAFKTFTITVNPRSQLIWNVNLNSGTTSPQVAADVKSSGAKVVVERQMYFHYTNTVNGSTVNAMGGTDVLGKPGPAAQTSYSFADGSASAGYDEVLVLQNPTTASETIHATLVNGLGVVYNVPAIHLAAKTCMSIDVASLVVQNMVHPGDGAAAYQVWMVVQSSVGQNFVAERASYWNANISSLNMATQGGVDVIGYYGY